MPTTDPFPFFVGCGRSGTTLLRTIFASHPELAVANESRFITSILANATRYGEGLAFDAGRLCRDVLDDPGAPSRLAAWPVDTETLRRAVVAAEPLTVADAVRAMYRLYADAHAKPRYGDKTPRYVNDVALIGRALPEARFVHLIRDGRDVALAWRDVPFGAAGTFEAAHLWCRKVQRARRDGAQLGPDRYLEVRYEDLVIAPEPIVREICAFLDLSFDVAMIDYNAAPASAFEELEDQDHHDSLRLPITPGLRDWRTQMTPSEMRRFEAVAGGLLNDLGYEVRGAGRAAPAYRALSRASFLIGRARVKRRRRAEASL